MTLGISDNGRPDLTRYIQWVSRLAPEVEWVTLSSQQGNPRELERCNGLILTGGGDVHPRFYGREDAASLMKNVDIKRDEFEFGLVRSALTVQVPILGICRGMQVFNVAIGGTMIPDVERAGFRNHRKNEDGSDRLHPVHVEKGTAVSQIIGSDEGEVNSSHHQAVERLGSGLRAAARSVDGVLEAAEWESTFGKPFVILVQWHPERMNEFKSPFCRNILQSFLNETGKMQRRDDTGLILTQRNISQ